MVGFVSYIWHESDYLFTWEFPSSVDRQDLVLPLPRTMSSPFVSDYETCPEWSEYPSKNTPYVTLGKDTTFYQSLLLKSEARLFETNNFEFWIIQLLHIEKVGIRS